MTDYADLSGPVNARLGTGKCRCDLGGAFLDLAIAAVAMLAANLGGVVGWPCIVLGQVRDVPRTFTDAEAL